LLGRGYILDKNAALELCERVIGASASDQTEVVVISEQTCLTRYSNSAIHQNVCEDNTRVHVRAVVGKRLGCASTNELSQDALNAVAEKALQVARLQQETADFVSLPEPSPLPDIEGYSPATACWTPQQRAEAVTQVIEIARAHDLAAAGAFSTQAYTIAVVNSLGVHAVSQATEANLTVVAIGEDSTGYADAQAEDVTAISPESVAQAAVDRCIKSRHPVAVDPGDWEVVLDHNAVGEMLAFLAYMGLGALALQEGRSFMTGKIGQRVCDSRVSIWDDALSPDTIRFPFDFEGVPRQKVDLITGGTAAGVVYDSYTAGRDGRQSTGHALLAPNPHGPMPANLHMASGEASREEMLASIDKGLLVTRFHYTNVVHPTKTVITGMTRDGTFLVENGEIVSGVKNLRFTQSVMEALSRVQMISRERRLASRCYCPQLHIEGFQFSGRTDF